MKVNVTNQAAEFWRAENENMLTKEQAAEEDLSLAVYFISYLKFISAATQ